MGVWTRYAIFFLRCGYEVSLGSSLFYSEIGILLWKPFGFVFPLLDTSTDYLEYPYGSLHLFDQILVYNLTYLFFFSPS